MMKATLQTPKRQAGQKPLGEPGLSRKYTEEEKGQLLANLDLEVKDRVRQFEAYLAQVLEAFELRHENEVTRIPRAIRNLTMAEFADKYDGDVNKALQAITKAKMALSEEPIGIADTARKRKWEASINGSQEAESSRGTKNARLASPAKREVSGARPRLLKTPGNRARRPLNSPSVLSVKKSPEKTTATTLLGKVQRSGMPSSQTFNPALPKTPVYPRRPQADVTESHVTSTPKFPEDPIAGPSGHGGKKLTRQRSMTVLRGPSPQDDPDAPATELVLSLKVPTKSGRLLELDPLSTTVEDLDNLQGVSDGARSRAKVELQELNTLMSRLGKWRI